MLSNFIICILFAFSAILVFHCSVNANEAYPWPEGYEVLTEGNRTSIMEMDELKLVFVFRCDISDFDKSTDSQLSRIQSKVAAFLTEKGLPELKFYVFNASALDSVKNGKGKLSGDIPFGKFMFLFSKAGQIQLLKKQMESDGGPLGFLGTIFVKEILYGMTEITLNFRLQAVNRESFHIAVGSSLELTQKASLWKNDLILCYPSAGKETYGADCHAVMAQLPESVLTDMTLQFVTIARLDIWSDFVIHNEIKSLPSVEVLRSLGKNSRLIVLKCLGVDENFDYLAQRDESTTHENLSSCRMIALPGNISAAELPLFLEDFRVNKMLTIQSIDELKSELPNSHKRAAVVIVTGNGHAERTSQKMFSDIQMTLKGLIDVYELKNVDSSFDSFGSDVFLCYLDVTKDMAFACDPVQLDDYTELPDYLWLWLYHFETSGFQPVPLHVQLTFHDDLLARLNSGLRDRADKNDLYDQFSEFDYICHYHKRPIGIAATAFPPGALTVLNKTSIGEFIGRHRNSMILFHLNVDPASCVAFWQFRKTADLASARSQRWKSSGVPFGTVACHDWPDVCDEYFVTSWPTILKFKRLLGRKSNSTYSGDFTVKPIWNDFMLDLAQHPLMLQKDGYESLIQRGLLIGKDIFILALFDEPQQEVLDLLKEETNYRTFYSKGRGAMEIYALITKQSQESSPNFPVLIRMDSSTGVYDQISLAHFDGSRVKSFILNGAAKHVIALSVENFAQIYHRRSPIVLLIGSGKVPSDGEAIASLDKVAGQQDFSSAFSFVFIDRLKYRVLAIEAYKLLNVTDSITSLCLAVSDPAKGKIYKANSAVLKSETTLSEWLNSVRTKSVESSAILEPASRWWPLRYDFLEKSFNRVSEGYLPTPSDFIREPEEPMGRIMDMTADVPGTDRVFGAHEHEEEENVESTEVPAGVPAETNMTATSSDLLSDSARETTGRVEL